MTQQPPQGRAAKRKKKTQDGGSKDDSREKKAKLSWVQSLKRFGFVYFGEYCQHTSSPNQNVTVSIKFWRNHELWVHILFRDTHELIQIYDTSLRNGSNYLTEQEIRRIDNLTYNIRRMSTRKEDLFPMIHNWRQFSNCTYLNHIVHYFFFLS